MCFPPSLTEIPIAILIVSGFQVAFIGGSLDSVI